MVVASGVLAACGAATPKVSSGETSTHTVTDMSGAKVAVPRKVDRIAEQFPAILANDLAAPVPHRPSNASEPMDRKQRRIGST
jgi:ABC-type Fe3+-hydroxamate transport system substrate-binding protein